MKYDDIIDDILQSIEFPGEDQERITEYLKNINISGRIMERISSSILKSYFSLFWIIISLADIALLLIFGGNETVIEEFFAKQEILSILFFLFLGLILSGSIGGLIFSINTSGFSSKLSSLRDSLFKRHA